MNPVRKVWQAPEIAGCVRPKGPGGRIACTGCCGLYRISARLYILDPARCMYALHCWQIMKIKEKMMKRCLYYFLGLVAALVLAVLSGKATYGEGSVLDGTETAAVSDEGSDALVSGAPLEKVRGIEPNQENP